MCVSDGNKCWDNRPPVPAQNITQWLVIWLLCIEEILISLGEHGGSKASQGNYCIARSLNHLSQVSYFGISAYCRMWRRIRLCTVCLHHII